MYIPENTAKDQFDEMLNEQGEIVIAGITFDPARILKEIDPIAYEEEFSNWADAMSYDFDEDNEDEDDEDEYDGQPTQQEEWASFDPDC